VPTDRLTTTPTQPATTGITEAVTAVLDGAPAAQVAHETGIELDQLTLAVENYHAAGRAALAQTDESTWQHVNLRFRDWNQAEQLAAAYLAPQLEHLHDAGTIGAWWFLRKYPYWRLRINPGPDHRETKNALTRVLYDLEYSGILTGWHPGIYEPERHAFGGDRGLAIAHRFQHTDSIGVLGHVTRTHPVLGRRELSMLLCTRLFSAAGLDLFEAGDTWDRIAALRPDPGSPEKIDTLARDLAALLTGAHHSVSVFAADRVLADAAPWARGFEQTGRQLLLAHDEGALERGPRQILAHLVIFHWNRLGLPVEAQAVLARAACQAVLPRD
jgi:thiopeptide-type bacteriocin biosynthesis protein